MGCFHSTCPTKVFTYDDRQDSLRGCGVGGKDPAGIFQHRLVLVGDNVWFLCFYILFSGSSKGFELFRLLGSLCKFSSDVDVIFCQVQQSTGIYRVPAHRCVLGAASGVFRESA